MIVPVFDPKGNTATSPGIVPFIRFEPTRLPNIAKVWAYGTMELRVIAELIAQGEKLMAVDHEVTHLDYYLELDTLLVQPKAEPTTTVDGLILRNLPPAATITSEGNSFEVDDAEVLLAFDMSGSYQVEVSSPVQKTVTLEVVKP